MQLFPLLFYPCAHLLIYHVLFNSEHFGCLQWALGGIRSAPTLQVFLHMKPCLPLAGEDSSSVLGRILCCREITLPVRSSDAPKSPTPPSLLLIPERTLTLCFKWVLSLREDSGTSHLSRLYASVLETLTCQKEVLLGLWKRDARYGFSLQLILVADNYLLLTAERWDFRSFIPFVKCFCCKDAQHYMLQCADVVYVKSMTAIWFLSSAIFIGCDFTNTN